MFVGTISSGKSGPASCRLAGIVRRANEDFGGGKLVAHADDIRRQAIFVVERPYPNGQAELLQVIDTLDGQRLITGFCNCFNLLG